MTREQMIEKIADLGEGNPPDNTPSTPTNPTSALVGPSGGSNVLYRC